MHPRIWETMEKLATIGKIENQDRIGLMLGSCYTSWDDHIQDPNLEGMDPFNRSCDTD